MGPGGLSTPGRLRKRGLQTVNSTLCVGIMLGQECAELTLLDTSDVAPRSVSFPPGTIGLAAVRSFLDGMQKPVRIVVAGATAVRFALSLGKPPGQEVMVAIGPCHAPMALARCALRRL